METPAYFQISPLTGYAMFIFRDLEDIGKENLYQFSAGHPFVACLDRPNDKDIFMICRILNFSCRESYRRTQDEVQCYIKEKTAMSSELLPETFVCLTYSARFPLFINDSPESFLPF